MSLRRGSRLVFTCNGAHCRSILVPPARIRTRIAARRYARARGWHWVVFRGSVMHGSGRETVGSKRSFVYICPPCWKEMDQR